MGKIDWKMSAKEIERLIRGLNPWPSAYTRWNENDKGMKIWEAEVAEGQTDKAAGTVVEVAKDGFFVQTGDGLLKITALQIPGKKENGCSSISEGISDGNRNGSLILRRNYYVLSNVL